MKNYDFSGWATKANLTCSDGRVIQPDAFKNNHGQTVPLVWNHSHNDPFNVLGHAVLENRPEGVYAYCKLNSTESGKNVKELIKHGDVSALSIHANRLKQQGSNVIHGDIKEVSLVLAGANPGAFIESIIKHGETEEEEANIFTGEGLSIYHSDDDDNDDDNDDDDDDDDDDDVKHSDSKKKEEKKVSDDTKKKDSDETVEDVFNTLSEKQKTVVYALIGQALSEEEDDDDDDDDDEGDMNMKHNIFDNDMEDDMDILTHSDMETIFSDAKRFGSLKESILEHGIEQIDYLFPDAKNVTNVPGFIQRDMGWVGKVMDGVHNTPFSRIKSIFADITEEEARAQGYIKGKFKKEEVFSLLKRTTTPQTIYKKQKLDRDDVIDIVDFDVVAWLKAEMRMMLDEEIARAILVGDGRLASLDEKIQEDKIRPIWKDSDLYTIKTEVEIKADDKEDDIAKKFIRQAIKSRKHYKGSGDPTLFTTEDVLTDCLLMEDTTGRVIYDSVAKLATVMRVKEIVTVPVMEDQKRVDGSITYTLMGIIVNLKDYNVGADRGGSVNMFDDFDIDYNAQKYLIETRCSGALIKPFSAIAIESKPVA